ncbi:hypothetical protein [Coprobacter sp.]
MKKPALSLLVFIPEILSAANKEWKTGYIVTTQNDTITGYIAYRKSKYYTETTYYPGYTYINTEKREVSDFKTYHDIENTTICSVL